MSNGGPELVDPLAQGPGSQAPARTETLTTSNDSRGASANYTLIVQVPLPVIGRQFDLIGGLVAPLLARTKVPEAVNWLIAHAASVFQKTVDVATALIRAIPEITVTILVRVGPVTVLNILLVAQKVPVEVPIPSFVLSLPNIGVGLNIDLGALIPVPPPIVVRVPIPVPVVRAPEF